MYTILDGRHRYHAAQLRGAPTNFRCDLITATGHALRVIPIDQLTLDRDVQIDFAFKPAHAARIAAKWDDRKVGILTVADDSLTVPERASIKLGLDLERRTVRPIESFLIAVKQGEATAVAIDNLAHEHGFEVGKLSGGKPYHRIEAVRALIGIYWRGDEMLRRTLILNTHWREDPKANTGFWLQALYLLVRDGYDEILTPNSWRAWNEVVPAKEIRRAQGEATSLSNANDGTVPAVSYQIAINMRKRAKLRVLPVGRPAGGKGGPARELR